MAKSSLDDDVPIDVLESLPFNINDEPDALSSGKRVRS